MRTAPAIQRTPFLRFQAAAPPVERRLVFATLALAAGLVLFGNAFSSMPVRLHDHPLAVATKVTLAVLLVAGTVAATALPVRELGICRERAGRGFAVGSGLALALSAPVIAYFAFPFGMPGGEIEYGVVDGKSTSAFLVWMLVSLPLATALFEEVAFRGCLQGVAVRAYGVAGGIALMAVAFTLWHGVINYKTIQDTNASSGPLLAGLAYGASALGLFAGGVIFGILRHRTGGIAAPFAFHWFIVLAMNTSLFVLSRT